MSDQKAGFFGKVVPAHCECHRGKFMVEAYALSPIDQTEILIASCPFETEEEASNVMVDFVRTCAIEFMKAHGIDPETIKEVEQSTGESADKMAKSYMRNHNPGLH